MTDLRHYQTPLRQTPFHPRTSAANRLHAWAPWAGYATVQTYDDLAMEHSAIRNAATLYDLCPMIKYRIEGTDAAACLNRLTVRDADRLAVGGVHYTVWCDDAGHLIDDGTLFRLAPDRYRLCCQERHLPWLLDSAFGFDVRITDETGEIAALALQGPTSAVVLRAAGFDIDTLKPFRMAEFPFAGGHLTISRTGFTGDLGYELWTTPDLALPLWDSLTDAGALYGLRPVGSEALNIARLEAGFIIAGQDFTPAPHCLREDRLRSPLEMGLGWLIDWDKGQFTGRRALLRQRERGPHWAFVGLEIEGNVAAEGAILYHNRKTEIGVITGACWSPTLKTSIALAQVKARHAKGGNLWAEIYALRELHYARMMMPARVVARPFFNPTRKRQTPPGKL
ncbi:aminomethyltransferase [Roseovarius azorensis]|uniref:Aminomethyltransferase n=1 Tax=Roseovarius azorensis TaxID=1287727 RepID=A0A1H7LL71_9RHOB|nr:aminomethyltransferase family protein [Roseovarius azorensis]SEK99599.1 aminomethyltransferase [Roseovarius azorensis]